MIIIKGQYYGKKENKRNHNKMKDQKRLLHKCLLEDIPAFVICGTDICSVQAMEAYYQIAVEKGCNSNFLEDLKLAIEDFKAFQCEEPEKVKIPD